MLLLTLTCLNKAIVSRDPFIRSVLGWQTNRSLSSNGWSLQKGTTLSTIMNMTRFSLIPTMIALCRIFLSLLWSKLQLYLATFILGGMWWLTKALNYHLSKFRLVRLDQFIIICFPELVAFNLRLLDRLTLTVFWCHLHIRASSPMDKLVLRIIVPHWWCSHFALTVNHLVVVVSGDWPELCGAFLRA